MTSLEAVGTSTSCFVSFVPARLRHGRREEDAYLSAKHPAASGAGTSGPGDAAAIETLTKAVGPMSPRTSSSSRTPARFRRDPDGRLARHFTASSTRRATRLGLVEASAGKIGTPVDQILLFCFHYDPANGKYGAVVVNIVRLAGVATVLAIGIGIWAMTRRRSRALTAVPGGVR